MSRIRHTSDNWSELDLICAIERRPILYDKTLPEYRKASLTEQAWEDVAKQVNASLTDVKKRWKSLRDTFIKYYRLDVLNDSPLNSRKKKWKFYDNLQYLRPHCELYRLDESSTSQPNRPKVEHEESRTTTIVPTYRSKIERRESPDKSSSETEVVLAEGGFQVVVEKPNEEPTEYMIYEDDEGEETKEDEEDGKEIFIEEQYTTPPVSTQPAPRQYSDDPDERFLLSCLPVFKRLPARKNSYLKLKIQTLLYEVEFSEDEPPARRTKYDY